MGDQLARKRIGNADAEKLLYRYSQQAAAAGVLPKLEQFPIAPEESVARSKKKLLRVRAYLKRNINKILETSPDSAIVFALFDREGFLLDLHGNSNAVDGLAENGITSDQLWTLNNIGPNAVTIGLSMNNSQITVGKENYVALLQKYAIYFCPVTLQMSKPPYTAVDVGGIAMFLPSEDHNPDNLIIVSSICHDITMTMHFNQTSNMQFERGGRAILTVDKLYKKGRNTVTHCSDIMFQIFGMEPFDIDFNDLELLIDPFPKNPELWEILNKKKRVTDESIVISTKGRMIPCIVTTDVFNQPGIPAGGVIFYITTRQYVSAGVSAKMGNSAVRSFENIVGQSPRIKSAIHRAKMLAATDSNVMLLGESGVGKDIFAQAIHNASGRRNKPFIAVNCGALPRDLISSELFGYADGAFTGAKKNGNIGKFELANGGTIFLDEIGELPLDLQVSLLRVVEQKQFMRVGGNEYINVDVKIISATNVNMAEKLEKKLFRQDLYYRLSAMRLEIPPLRARDEDIVLLAEFFIQMIAQRTNREDGVHLSAEAKKLLKELPWPGNVRELQNLIESIVQLYPMPVIDPQHILENINMPSQGLEIIPDIPYLPYYKKNERNSLTRQDILEALEKCDGNRSKAARTLGIARKTLYRNMERLGM